MSRALRASWRVAREEWRMLARQRLALGAAALMAVLVLASALASHQQRAAIAAQREALQARVQAQFEAQPDRHPHRMVHYGQFVFRPLPPLAAFDAGVDAWTGNMLFVEGHRQNSTLFAEARQSTLLLRFGQLAPAFALQVLAPLLLVFLGFGAVTRERERGHLRLMLAQGAPAAALLAGKALALAGVAAAAAAPAALALGLAAWRGEAGWAQAGGLLGLHALYLAGWVALVVLVSSVARRGRDALLVLVGLWIATVVLLPRTAPVAAQALHPLPTRIETDVAIHREAMAIGDSHDPDDPYFADFRARVLAEHGVERIEDLPVNYAGLVSAEGERLTSALYDRHAAAGFAREQAQADLVGALGWLGPVIALRQASMELAGTDLRAYQRFLVEAEAYRYALVQALNGLHAEAVAFEGDKEHRLHAATWSTLPRFEPSREAPAGHPRTWRATWVLGAWLALPVLLLGWRARRLGGA